MAGVKVEAAGPVRWVKCVPHEELADAKSCTAFLEDGEKNYKEVMKLKAENVSRVDFDVEENILEVTFVDYPETYCVLGEAGPGKGTLVCKPRGARVDKK